MHAINTPCSVSLTGEVVEIFEREGIQLAKISCRPVHLELPMAMLDAAHLGDTVHLEGIISIQNVEPDIRFEDPDFLAHSDPDLYP